MNLFFCKKLVCSIIKFEIFKLCKKRLLFGKNRYNIDTNGLYFKLFLDFPTNLSEFREKFDETSENSSAAFLCWKMRQILLGNPTNSVGNPTNFVGKSDK